MLTVPVYNQLGEKIGEMELPVALFGVEPKISVVHQVVTALQANQRKNIAHTKTRADVRGGGRKPWKQKGTGRARHGSIRSPLWRGGGVTFGPRNIQNFSKKINQKMKQRAFCMGLTAKVQDQKIAVLDEVSLQEPKTKELVGVLNVFFGKVMKTDVQKKNKQQPKTLIVLKQAGPVVRAGRNVSRLSIRTAHTLGLLDILQHERIIMEQGAIQSLAERKAFVS